MMWACKCACVHLHVHVHIHMCRHTHIPVPVHVHVHTHRLNGTEQVPMLYDPEWGGAVSCGCDYDGSKGELGDCVNSFPECPGWVWVCVCVCVWVVWLGGCAFVRACVRA